MAPQNKRFTENSEKKKRIKRKKVSGLMSDNQRKSRKRGKRLEQAAVAAVTEATKQKTFSLHVSGEQLRMLHKTNCFLWDKSEFHKLCYSGGKNI